jgi:periplasmic protein TonB
MCGKAMARKFKFTLAHGLAVSLLLHSGVAAPFAVHIFMRQTAEAEPLVIDVQGLIADSQSEQKIMRETKGEARPQAPPPAPSSTPAPRQSNPSPRASPPARQAAQKAPDAPLSPDPAIEKVAEAPQPRQAPPQRQQPPAQPPHQRDRAAPTAATPASGAPMGANDVNGLEEPQAAQTIKQNQRQEADRLRTYVKLMAKKVQTHLVYPAGHAGLHGIARVSFTILGNGEINPASLQLVGSSGQSLLDAAALQTIRASSPFGSPPAPITITIGVAFGRMR